MPIYTSSVLSTTGATITGGLLQRTQLYDSITTGQTITFSNAGVTGRFGPTYAQCISAYSSQPGFSDWGSDKKLFDCSAGIQFWTVFKTGSYTITCAGAGTPRGNSTGRGAIVTSSFSLNAGEVLRIMVGQRGSSSGNYAGGGGGTAVSVYRLGTTSLLIAAGGGQGSSNNATTTSGNGDGRASNRSGVPDDGFGSYYDHAYGTDIAYYWHGGGGSGWAKDGAWGGIGVWGMNHFVEGASLSQASPIGGRDEQGIVGGFGGGAASGRDGGTGGGGGGFDGGDCSYVSSGGPFAAPYRHGGGGSFSSNGSFSSTSTGGSGRTDDGYVSITCP